ncbi:IclR family transcriptional regulator [Rhodoligotrophos defluvii]|uniref:IclR family transcriptional regulator n=1 Tax=Rhodoligotrophos defluvii TaxID=2561934 RepID=UPI001EF151FF|nr:IclR family transcriptional regulator [Rhodoligotrophos defluvii]
MAGPVREAARGNGIQAVEFALHILEYIAQHHASVGVSELARAFGTTKSRIHRHLQTLVSAGYLVRDPDTERYNVSARLVALGQAVSESFDLAAVGRPIARELRDQLGNAVAISQPDREGIRIILIIPSRSNIEVAVKPGSVLHYHASAQGKVSLAFGDPQLLEQVIERGLTMITPYTISDPARLREEIEATRKRRWAAAPNEAMIGLNALAAPIFDALGNFAGSIALTDSVQFIPETPTAQQVEALLHAAGRISEEMGNRSMNRDGGQASRGRLKPAGR